jgi:hypothetical protein
LPSLAELFASASGPFAFLGITPQTSSVVNINYDSFSIYDSLFTIHGY